MLNLIEMLSVYAQQAGFVAASQSPDIRGGEAKQYLSDLFSEVPTKPEADGNQG